MFDAIVIGAGIAGISLAYELTRRSQKVLLIDKNDPVQECSRGFSGLLTTVADSKTQGPYVELSRMSLAYWLE